MISQFTCKDSVNLRYPSLVRKSKTRSERGGDSFSFRLGVEYSVVYCPIESSLRGKENVFGGKSGGLFQSRGSKKT